MIKRLVVKVLLAAASLRAQTSSVEVKLMTEPVIQERLEMVSRKLAERRATLEKLFSDSGCTVTSQPVRGSKEPNLICTLKGTDPAAGVIVVGGHFDLITAGMGAIDDWSGSVLLPSLYESLKGLPRRHDYVFVAFTAEETGLNGSHEYVNKLTGDERKAIRAMINLECLGLEGPKVWGSRADPHLLESYARVISALHIPAAVVNVEKVGDDDSHSFRDAGIPTLTIHSITQATFPLLHTSRDKVSAIHPEVYYTTYRMAATLLAFLDGQ
jgi:Zn-dependent M28 family amino/carboxypeptidase